MTRRHWRRIAGGLAMVAGLSGLPLTASPAGAVTLAAAGGAINADVDTTIDLLADGVVSPCPPSTHTLNTNLTGVFNIAEHTALPHNLTMGATLSITAKATSTSECAARSSGTLNVETCAGTGTEIDPTAPNPLNVVLFGAAITCSGLVGTFQRVGPVVIANVGGGSVCIQDGAHSSVRCGSLSAVVVVATVFPKVTGTGVCPHDPSHQCIYEANLVGAFAGAGVDA